MKKQIALIVSLAILLGMAAFAENESIFAELESLEWSFSSGAGAWSTDMRILEDGSFTGEYHDSEMGESGKDYPEGTIYCSSFTGKMSFVEQVDENSMKIRIDELTVREEVGTEVIDSGIRFVIVEPFGLSQGDEMILYRPGTPINALTEDMQFWAHVQFADIPVTELKTWFLSSEKNESGFVGENYDDYVSMENPWQEMSAEELWETSGLCLAVPQGAENLTYSYLPDEELAQMMFTIDGDEFCARVVPAALGEGELMNISGMYMYWEDEETITVGHCGGTFGQTNTGSSDWVQLCLWYDAAPGIMYSLSVYTADPDGLDLVGVAEQVYIPMQGDVG